MDTARFDRQIRLFGVDGQARIESQTVAIVGLGGLGSHVAQQLAYLGVRSFYLIDRDTVSRSNLNRLIGATGNDAAMAQHKVDVAKRLIQMVDASASVTALPSSFISDDGFHLMRQASVVFGCMDNDAPRLILNEFSQAYEKLYIDIATDTNPEEKAFGGRVIIADGEICLHCKDQLDQDMVRAAFASDAQKAEEERIYGVPRSVLGDVGPAVVSLNGVLASLAVTEFMAFTTGMRSAIKHLEYRGSRGVVTADRTPLTQSCYYCRSVRGKAQQADVERYIRQGWGEKL